MRARADEQRASLSTQALSEGDWAQYVRYLDGADAVAAYADHLSTGPPMPAVERALADRLVIERGWADLDVLDAGHPLRRDAAEVMAAVGAMDAGEWARAADLLQGVPRRSPFAAWRLFCRAAVCFGADDDDGLRRTLDRLPADFPLARTVAEWRRLAAPDVDGRAGAPGGAADGRGPAATLARELKRALRKGNVRAAGTAIEGLADVLYAEEPGLARIDLLEIAGLAAIRDFIPGSAFEALARRLSPADRAPGVLARVLLGGQQAEPGLWHPAPAAALLDALPAEFPRAEDRPLARACVLETLARTGRKAVHPELLPADMASALNGLLGRRAGDPAMVFVDLMTASLEADPDNRDGYLFVLELLRGHGAAKRRLQGVLQDMADRFPDDPTPWLELATLHYSKNAYRRAEATLAEARLRAPHDDRLLDLQAVGFLKSADQSRNKGRFELAAQDLERAADLGRKAIEPVLPGEAADAGNRVRRRGRVRRGRPPTRSPAAGRAAADAGLRDPRPGGQPPHPARPTRPGRRRAESSGRPVGPRRRVRPGRGRRAARSRAGRARHALPRPADRADLRRVVARAPPAGGRRTPAHRC